MKELAAYVTALENIKQDCLKALPYGSPEWPKYKDNEITKANFTNSRNSPNLQIQISQIQKSYKDKLYASGVSPEKINQIIQEDKHQFKLRKQYALLGVERIGEFGVAACNEMTQLTMVKIKERFPELKAQFAVLKHYNHGFVVIENPNNKEDKLVFDLFAHGFDKPVIYPVKDLEKNMGGFELKPITFNEITPMNKKYHEVWQGKGKAPLGTYAVKLELSSNEVFQQTNSYSMGSLCRKFGTFAVIATAVGVSYYLANSTKEGPSLELTL